jgi:putative nucleotidyltransferase with HDIG domain
MNGIESNLIRVLAVDDEQSILDLYQAIFHPKKNLPEPTPGGLEQDLGTWFDLTLCRQGDEAVEAVGSAIEEKNPFAVIFLDMMMPPGPDGMWTAEGIRALDPYTEIVFVTGYSDVKPKEISSRVLPQDKLFYLKKPFYPDEILQLGLALGAKWDSERNFRTVQAELEGRVRERTAQLARANKHLQQDIARRKQTEEELQNTLGKLQEVMGGIIQAMATTLETRDPYTAGHQRRVADLAYAIASEMGLSKDQLIGIRTAGALHDLGKISVPAEILSKPSRLIETEFCLIKRHCQVGYEILQEIGFPWPVARTVLQHHERVDGSGYPQGLSGEDILLEARVLAVADVVEAMASHRPYRPALGMDRALEEVFEKKGKLYDSEVVDACLRLYAKRGFQFRQ